MIGPLRPAQRRPAHGWAFVKRRMTAELGADWQRKFESFEHQPAPRRSLGQVHRGRAHDGTALACKLQYSRHAVGGWKRICSSSSGYSRFIAA